MDLIKRSFDPVDAPRPVVLKYMNIPSIQKTVSNGKTYHRFYSLGWQNWQLSHGYIDSK